jgi:hypothetical protein
MGEEYIMVPSSLFPQPIVGGGDEPQPVVMGKANVRDTDLVKNLSLKQRGNEALSNPGPPEISLQLYNFLQGLYRSSIEQPILKDMNEEIREVKSDPESYQVHINALPKTAQHLAPGLLHFLTTNTPVKIDKTGFATYQNKETRVHIVDIMKALLSSKGTVNQATRVFINYFLSLLPTSYIKNKTFKTEETHGEWDLFN